MNAMKNDGGPAFPQDLVSMYGTRTSEGGMTLRDYFAASAIQNAIDFQRSVEKTWPGWSAVAQTAYNIADAMLAARGAA